MSLEEQDKVDKLGIRVEGVPTNNQRDEGQGKFYNNHDNAPRFLSTFKVLMNNLALRLLS